MIPTVSSQVLLLALVYVFLAFLLLCLLLATRWHWTIKAGAVVLVSGFYALSHDTLQRMAGWPSDDRLPERFVLLSAVFDEPRPSRGHPGAIYIWVHPMKDNQPLEMPRVHRLPYEKDLQRILGEGIKKARDGNTQMGSLEPTRGGTGFAWLRSPADEKLQLKLTDLPRAQLPEK